MNNAYNRLGWSVTSVVLLAAPALLQATPPDTSDKAPTAAPAGDRATARDAPPHGRNLLTDLPDALSRSLAGFDPNAFRELNRAYRGHARLETRGLTIQGPITIEELKTLLERHPNVSRLTFDSAPALTEDGVLAALRLRPRLQSMRFNRKCELAFTTAQWLELVRSHPDLTSLAVGARGSFTDEVVQAFGPRLLHLEIRQPRLSDAAFRDAGKLESLTLSAPPSFTGEHLPLSLRVLDVTGDSISGHALPPDLAELTVLGSEAFTLEALPVRLRKLVFDPFGGARIEEMRTALERLAHLEELDLGPPVDNNLVNHLPRSLTSLSLWGSNLEKQTFGHLTHLRTLKLRKVAGCTGEGLPKGLQKVSLVDCPGFLYTNLAGLPLQALTVFPAGDAEELSFLAPTLRELHLLRPAPYAPAQVAACLNTLPNLEILKISSEEGLEAPGAVFDQHRHLKLVEFVSPEGYRLWARATAGPGVPWHRVAD